jgi:hypothetical protein
MAASSPAPGEAEPSLLERVRNMSEFAALMQYLFIFGDAVKAEDLEVEVCSLPAGLVALTCSSRISSRNALRRPPLKRSPN